MIQTSVAISPIYVCFSAFFSRRAYQDDGDEALVKRSATEQMKMYNRTVVVDALKTWQLQHVQVPRGTVHAMHKLDPRHKSWQAQASQKAGPAEDVGREEVTNRERFVVQ